MKDQPKTPGAMVLDRELINRIAKQRTPADWGAAIDELRATLAANPEANSPCPQCGGSLSTWGCTCTPRWPMHKPADHIEDARAMVEQTPASPMAEHIRQAMIADGSQEGVNIAEGRFGKAMAALCVQLDGQTPAVGGEPEEQTRRTSDVRDEAYDNGWNECREAYRAHVAPLLAEIERLKENYLSAVKGRAAFREACRKHRARIAELEAQLAKANDWSHLKPSMDPQKP